MAYLNYLILKCWKLFQDFSFLFKYTQGLSTLCGGIIEYITDTYSVDIKICYRYKLDIKYFVYTEYKQEVKANRASS